MIGFYLKKFITFFIQPFGLILTISIVGLYFLLTKKYNLAKIFISLSVFLLLLFSYVPFSNFLINNLETQYPKYAYTNKDITYIHVLGSGNRKSKTQPISSYFGSSGIKRVIEGIIIYKKTPHSKLIFTGYSGNCNPTPAAQVYAELALALGVKKEDIILGIGTKDTKEEASFTKKIVGKEKFILVTSASHMPRAMLTFQKAGLNPIAAPTDFHNYKNISYLTIPNVKSIIVSQLAIHEYLGIIWTKIVNYL